MTHCERCGETLGPNNHACAPVNTVRRNVVGPAWRLIKGKWVAEEVKQEPDENEVKEIQGAAS